MKKNVLISGITYTFNILRKKYEKPFEVLYTLFIVYRFMHVHATFSVALIGVDFFFDDIKLGISNTYFKKLCKSFMNYAFLITLFHAGATVNNVNISVRSRHAFQNKI